ncbi:MAG: hypothetical protein JNM27_15820 [Leptospirales bacterium]|nr:hypothetical protein [Leptospirales bacterium]
MKKLCLPLLLLLLVSCQFSAGKFKRMDKEAPKGLIDVGGRVEGENCEYFFPLAGQPSFEKATRQAIRRSPEGTTGLRDVTMETYYGLILAHVCFKVSGIPVRE